MSVKVQRVRQEGLSLVAGRTGSVRFAFTERTGGVSTAPYKSLNLGTHVGDNPNAVQENRARVLSALGAAPYASRLLVPNQVHGDHIVTVTSADVNALNAAQSELAQGADAVVCTASGVPVMLCFADCVPVILLLKNAFAIAHSGWKGTRLRIAAKAASALATATGEPISQVQVLIGPHILGDEYQVSSELQQLFSHEFDCVRATSNQASCTLDLSACIVEALLAVGVPRDNIVDSALSTVQLADRFYSYRREGGLCGRHGAVAYREPEVQR